MNDRDDKNDIFKMDLHSEMENGEGEGEGANLLFLRSHCLFFFLTKDQVAKYCINEERELIKHCLMSAMD